jgi:hypothetical protein
MKRRRGKVHQANAAGNEDGSGERAKRAGGQHGCPDGYTSGSGISLGAKGAGVVVAVPGSSWMSWGGAVSCA